MTETLEISGPAFVAGRTLTADDLLAPDYLAFDPADESQARVMAAYALADVPGLSEPLLPPGAETGRFVVLVAGADFGAGSARAHPAAALRAAGIRAVLAPSFSPRFHRMVVNGGWFVPLAVPQTVLERIVHGTPVHLTCAADGCLLRLDDSAPISLPGLGVVFEILRAGGLLALLRNEKPSARKQAEGED